MLQVVLSTAPMVPEPSSEPMAVACYPPAATAPAAASVCNLPPVPDLDMLLPPVGSPAPRVLPAPQPAILQLAPDSRATISGSAAAPGDAAGPAAMDVQPLQPSGGLCMQPSSFSDTLPFAEELAAVAAQLAVSITLAVHEQHLHVSCC
jgi:hypothetical protein